jgi:hypothetical protein
MEWRTELHIVPSTQKLNHSHAIMLIGSCFSQNIGLKLSQYKFRVISNPFGTVFNPVSIARLLMYACHPTSFDEGQMMDAQGVFVHPDFYKTLGNTNRAAAVSQITQALEDAHHFLENAGFLFITLGTSTGYVLKTTGNIVANCHKLPSARFEKTSISVEHGYASLKSALEALFTFRPDLKVVFTVSPVRHTREGIVENARSKARLHVMIENIQQDFPEVLYFPAYEWMMDDLRDYRFYQQDLIHPNDMAIQYIWDKFGTHFFGQDTIALNTQIEKIMKAVRHRPALSDHPAYLTLLAQTKIAMQEMEEKFPDIDFKEEKNLLLLR